MSVDMCEPHLLVSLEVVLLQAPVQDLGGQVPLRPHPAVGRDVQAVALRHVSTGIEEHKVQKLKDFVGIVSNFLQVPYPASNHLRK